MKDIEVFGEQAKILLGFHIENLLQKCLRAIPLVSHNYGCTLAHAPYLFRKLNFEVRSILTWRLRLYAWLWAFYSKSCDSIAFFQF